jgi:hypothetical protein
MSISTRIVSKSTSRRLTNASAEKLAKWFTLILAGGLILHYACLMVIAFWGQKEQIEVFGQVFHGWFPAMTSIVSAAATFYFAKER